jgi:hypothetical protein
MWARVASIRPVAGSKGVYQGLALRRSGMAVVEANAPAAA